MKIKQKKEADSLLFSIARSVFVARSRCGLTQKQLAKRVGTAQSGIARLENSVHFPGFNLVSRVAKALDQKIIFEFYPKDISDIRFMRFDLTSKHEIALNTKTTEISDTTIPVSVSSPPTYTLSRGLNRPQIEEIA